MGKAVLRTRAFFLPAPASKVATYLEQCHQVLIALRTQALETHLARVISLHIISKIKPINFRERTNSKKTKSVYYVTTNKWLIYQLVARESSAIIRYEMHREMGTL